MIDNNTDFFVILWEKICEYIPEKKRQDAAIEFLENCIEEASMSIDISDLVESNPYLDRAYAEMTKEDDIDFNEEIDFDE